MNVEPVNGWLVVNDYWTADYHGQHREGTAALYWLARWRARRAYRRLRAGYSKET